jgi:hypothetical protein
MAPVIRSTINLPMEELSSMNQPSLRLAVRSNAFGRLINDLGWGGSAAPAPNQSGTQ